jgi:diguanylate cyclase (GGDEF)-like protein/PAS domain S-box-containing protein
MTKKEARRGKIPRRSGSAQSKRSTRASTNKKNRSRTPPPIPPRPEPQEITISESILFHAIIDNTTDRIYFKDRESRFLLINRTLAEHLGLSDPAEAVGKTDFDFFAEEHARQAYLDEQEIIAYGRSLVGIEKKELWPDGREAWVSTSKIPIRNPEDKIIGTFGISRDITSQKSFELSLLQSNQELEKINRTLQMEIAERKRTDETLARERDLFRMLMDNTTDRIYFKDRESRFLLINKSTSDWLGLKDPSQAAGKTDFDFFSDEHARQAYTDEQKIIADGRPLVGIEEKETWPDGRTTWVSSSKLPFRNPEGDIAGTFGISRDITDYKLGEEARIRAAALREANVELEKINLALQAEVAERKRVENVLAHERDLFRAMMDNTTDRIYFKDRDSRFLLINQALAAHFGIADPSDAVGKRDFDYFSEEHARQAFDDEQSIVSSDQPFVRKEEKETWPDGHATWVSTTKFPLRDQNGRIIGTFGISRDITERKAIELSIAQANDELEKTNAALHAEIADRRRAEEALAHESNLFRTLMNSTADRIYFKDEDSRFLLVNRALADKFGLKSPSEANGKTDFNFFSEEYAGKSFEDERQIISSGKPIADIEEREIWPDGRETWVSTSKFPMCNHEGKVIGTFGISREITERKSMEAAIQLANDKLAMMVNWLEGRNRDISVLNEMGNRLEACRSPEEAYPAISEQMEKLIPVSTGKLFLFDESRHRLNAVAHWGTDPAGADSFLPEECRGILSGQPYLVNAEKPEKYCPHVNVTSGEEPVSMCLPLISHGETTGLLHLRGKREQGTGALPDLKQQMAVMAAEHITLALANLSLRESLRLQSIHDALTGLYNRRYLEESLIHELARTKRRETALGVIMMDVDRLKQVNDTYGHEAGDALLQLLSNWLQSNVRRGDISCRYGGDEFVVILPDASLEDTILRARQICEGIRTLKVEHQGRSLGRMSVSVGVAGFPKHGETRDQLLEAVDAALYKAKEQGRDCVAVAGG